SEDLIWTGDIQHSIGGEGRHFEAKVFNRKNPFQFQRIDVGGVDLLERAVAVGRKVSVIAEPITGLRRSRGDFAWRLARDHGARDGSHVHNAQVSGERNQILSGQIRERRHTGAYVPMLQKGTQLFRRLLGYAWIPGEGGA